MGSRSPFEEAIFRGKDMPDDTAVSYAKVAKAIEMPFGLWTWMRPTKHVLHGGAHWRNQFVHKCLNVPAPVYLSNDLQYTGQCWTGMHSAHAAWPYWKF